MKKILLILLLQITTFSISAQNLLKPEPVTWEKLQLLQYKVIAKSDDDFSLSPQCFYNIESYEHLLKERHLQTVLWTTYVWDKYRMPDGLDCLVMIENLGQKDETYKILSHQESKTLLSASLGQGFEEKGFNDYADEINKLNSISIENFKDSLSKNSLQLSPAMIKDNSNVEITEKGTTIKLSQQNSYFDELNSTEVNFNNTSEKSSRMCQWVKLLD